MNNSVNEREKTYGFIYVLLFFIVFSCFFGWLLFFANSGFKSLSQKEFAINKMNYIKEYQNAESEYMPMVDSLNRKIEAFNPGINAIYEENDINYLINRIKHVYEQKSWDLRYKSFLHIAQFYEMWLIDKKDLWNKKQNIQLFKTNLEECEIGLTNKKNELGTKK